MFTKKGMSRLEVHLNVVYISLGDVLRWMFHVQNYLPFDLFLEKNKMSKLRKLICEKCFKSFNHRQNFARCFVSIFVTFYLIFDELVLSIHFLFFNFEAIFQFLGVSTPIHLTIYLREFIFSLLFTF